MSSHSTSCMSSIAMYSLKAATKWDEDVFDLEYDLDLFNIVAVPDFNMGAMENKSLNIFNSKLVLATPETATDSDYAAILGVIGHEVVLLLHMQYFHNWTGNRFGTISAVQGSDTLKQSEEHKRKARAERFGLAQSVTADEEAKKKARLSRFGAVLAVPKANAQEEDKKKARALSINGTVLTKEKKFCYFLPLQEELEEGYACLCLLGVDVYYSSLLQLFFFGLLLRAASFQG
ncbi:hypothetical protein C3L33_22639, partial [Rhododendron williamsianum]